MNMLSRSVMFGVWTLPQERCSLSGGMPSCVLIVLWPPRSIGMTKSGRSFIPQIQIDCPVFFPRCRSNWDPRARSKEGPEERRLYMFNWQELGSQTSSWLAIREYGTTPPEGLLKIFCYKLHLSRFPENYIPELTLLVTSLWKPIRGPVYDFPLTLCDRRTVYYASQTTAMDIITHHFINENTRVYFNEKHEWYYWHGFQVDEVIAFVQADSKAENRSGMCSCVAQLLSQLTSSKASGTGPNPIPLPRYMSTNQLWHSTAAIACETTQGSIGWITATSLVHQQNYTKRI